MAESSSSLEVTDARDLASGALSSLDAVESASWARRFALWAHTPLHSTLLIICAITAARLVAAAVIPLTEDEAYYRLWAQHLHLGYYDHPPMIAWWIWAGEHIAGSGYLGVRLISILSCAATSFALFDLLIHLDADRTTAGRAALWFQAMPMISLGGMLAIPDSPSTFCWCLALCCLARVRNSSRWWLAAGTAVGLGLLSKYSTLFLIAGAGVWLIIDHRLGQLRKPWPWLGLAIAVLLFSLNIYWNAGHQWVSFDKQFGRAAPARFAPQHLIEFLLGQALFVGPFMAVFLFKSIRGRIWRHNIAANQYSLLLATCLPFIAYLAFHSVHDRVQGHWPAPLYPEIAALAAVAAAEIQSPVLRWIRKCVVPFGIAVGAIGLAHLALPVTDIFGGKDPAGMVRGWPSFAEQLNLLARLNRASWVGTSAYSTAAELNDQALLKLPALQLAERDRYSPEDRSRSVDLSKPGLVVDLPRRLNARDLSACFATVRELNLLLRGAKDGAHEAYSVYYVAGALPNLLVNGCAIH